MKNSMQLRIIIILLLITSIAQCETLEGALFKIESHEINISKIRVGRMPRIHESELLVERIDYSAYIGDFILYLREGVSVGLRNPISPNEEVLHFKDWTDDTHNYIAILTREKNIYTFGVLVQEKIEMLNASESNKKDHSIENKSHGVYISLSGENEEETKKCFLALTAKMNVRLNGLKYQKLNIDKLRHVYSNHNLRGP